MGAAFLAPPSRLVDAIAVGMVGDDEDAGLGERGSCGTKECTGQKRREGSHIAPMNERAVLTSNKPNWLKMMNAGSCAMASGSCVNSRRRRSYADKLRELMARRASHPGEVLTVSAFSASVPQTEGKAHQAEGPPPPRPAARV